MKDGMFVFDNVVHMYDNTDDNLLGEEGRRVAGNVAGAGQLMSTEEYPANEDFLGSQLAADEAYKILFENSDTDIAMAQTVPLFSWWRNGFSPAERNYEFARAYPERVLFCGGVDPVFQGVRGAVDELERQVVEWGAKSMKFYQTHGRGLGWRADDRLIAYPLWERCLELGITHVQFHKGAPFGTEHMEDMRPNDIQDAAVDFPELTFIIHHLGDPYIDETISIAGRNPNVWLALSAWVNAYPIMPMESLHRIGKALMLVGPDKLVYGSEAFVWPNLQGYLDIFANLVMPEELQDGYGYPEITREMKEKILGLNYAGLVGIDVDAKLEELYGESRR